MNHHKSKKLDVLDAKIVRIQKSTKTFFPFFAPINDWFRLNFKFYYDWHLKPNVDTVHWMVLVVVIIIAGFFIFRLNGPDSITKAISNVYVRTDGNDTNCDGTTNAPYPGSGGPGLNCAVLTISKGIELADSGGMVLVSSGFYNVTNVYVTKPLTLRSLDGIGEAKIVTSENNGAVSIDGINNVIIDGFDISGPSTPPGGEPFGIFINNNSNIRITNCYIHDIAPGYSSLANGNGGIVIGNEGSTNVEIDHNKFYNFYNVTAGVKSYGINMNSNTVTDNVSIHDNEFFDIYSPGSDDAGIRVSAQKANLILSIENNSFNNVGDRAIWIRRAHTNIKLISGNTMVGGTAGAGGAGIELKNSADEITGNTISGYLKCILLDDNATSAPTITNNNLSCLQNGIEIGANVTAITTIQNNIIENNQYGILSNTGTAPPIINNNKICNIIKNISNLATGTIDAKNNYFCTTDNSQANSMLNGPVDYRPFYINDSETILSPGVTEVSSTTVDGTYVSGAIIIITIKFSESVNITGVPKIKLNIGPTARYAEYSSGSGSNTLSFTYNVQSGDSANLLDYDSTNALELNGGAITATLDGLNSTLTLPATGTFTQSHKIIISTAVPSPSTPATDTPAATSPSPVSAETTPAQPSPVMEEAKAQCPSTAETVKQIDCTKCFCQLFWYLVILLISCALVYLVYYSIRKNISKSHHKK